MLLPILAQAEAAEPPASHTIQETLNELWTDFLGHLPFFGAGIVVILVTWGVGTLAGYLTSKSLKPTKFRHSLQDLISRFVVVGVWIVGIMIAAVVIFPGLTPAKALGGLGLMSIAIGFAFKDIFENFFAGILLLWRFPFERGDFLECEGITGRVVSIDVRMTQIRRTTGELVVLPNSYIFKQPCDILTNLSHRRVGITAGVSYDTNLEEAVEVIRKAVSACGTVVKERPVQIFPKEFASSGIDIEVAWWTGSKPVEIRTSRAEVIVSIKKALDAAGIEIPFPYRTLTFKQPLQVEQFASEDESYSNGHALQRE